jgi:energy-coupling factor transporter transmembrane protein EcfT
MDTLKTWAINHILASHGIVAFTALCVAKIDWLIKLALKFVPAQVLKDEVDRLDAAAKARIDRDAAQPPAN